MTKTKISLLLLTIVLIVIMLLIPNIVKSNIPYVEVINPVKTTYSQYISCDGEIVDSLKENIITDVPIVPGQIFVKEGDYVKAGQKIMDVNREATINSLGNLSASEVLSAFMTTDIDKLPEDFVSQILLGGKLSDETVAKYVMTDAVPSAVYATTSGIVTEVSARSGVMLQALSSVASIAENDEKVARISVGENNISKIMLGQKVIITGLAFPGQMYTGTTTEIAKSARKILKGTTVETVVDVTVSLDSYEGLKPGYTAKAKISLTPERRVLTVPYEYVMQDDAQNEYVYLYENGRAVKQVIKTGVELVAGFEVVKGIDEYSAIITNPDVIYYDGSYVRLNKED